MGRALQRGHTHVIPLRLALYGAAALALIGGIGGVVWKAKHDEAAKWRPKVEAAQQQARNNETASVAQDHFIEHTTIIREKADAATQVVRELPHASDAIDADRRAALCAQLASVRDGPVCSPDDAGSVSVQGAVRGSDDTATNPG